jgi:membrane-bound serine protease (ClpP class)
VQVGTTYTRPTPLVATSTPSRAPRTLGRMTPSSFAGTSVARRLGLLLIGVGLLVGTAAAASAQPSDPAARIDVVELEGSLDPRLMAHLEEAVAAAGDQGVGLVVITLDSAGALRVSPQRLVAVVESSQVPVMVWVGPQGARATGGAALLAHAAHLLGVAPGTIVGDARPLDFAAPTADPEIAGALLAALAEERGRDADLAVRMATQGARVVVVGDGEEAAAAEALSADGELAAGLVVLGQTEAVRRGTVDLVAGSLSDALLEASGRQVVVGGSTVVLDLDPGSASVRFNNPGLIRRMLHTVATPALAYLLVVGGALCLAFELFQPGFGVAGVTGGVLAVLGGYGLAVLPVSWIAVALLVGGLALLAVDLAVAGLGPVTAAGTAAFGAGSYLLYSPSDQLGLPLWLIALMTVGVAVFFVVVMTVVLRAQGSQAMAGAEQLVGKVGVVRSVLNPEGHVFVEGALWRGRAPEAAGKVRTGTQVRVVRLDDNLTLEVELVEADSPVG